MNSQELIAKMDEEWQRQKELSKPSDDVVFAPGVDLSWWTEKPKTTLMELAIDTLRASGCRPTEKW